MNTLSRSLLLASGLIAIPVASRAAVTVTWTQVGDNFHAVVAGSLSAAELAEASSVSGSFSSQTAFFDTTPSFGIFLNDDTDQYTFSYSKLTLISAFTRMNSYSGNQQTGTTPFGFYDTGSSVVVTVAPTYQAGGVISASLTSYRYGMSLNQAFTFGDVIKLNGNAFITYVNGGITPVPEPSAYGLALGGLALAAVALRRRSKVSK